MIKKDKINLGLVAGIAGRSSYGKPWDRGTTFWGRGRIVTFNECINFSKAGNDTMFKLEQRDEFARGSMVGAAGSVVKYIFNELMQFLRSPNMTTTPRRSR